MELLLNRLYDNGNDTIGILYYRDQFKNIRYAYTLEDEYRDIKVKGETRIPAGSYSVMARKGGRIYDAFSKSSVESIRNFTQKYGVLEIMNVPDFSAVLFHTGNKENQTNACILLGDFINNNSNVPAYLSDSVKAYTKFIQAIEHYLDKREPIYIEIRNLDRDIEGLI
jgi:hypothetical protein